MLGARALARIEATTSTSFSLDLKKWLQIMQTYESGGHAYHATLPTDGLARLRDVMQELAAFGFDRAKVAQQQLGDRVRALLAHEGIASVAASGFQSPGWWSAIPTTWNGTAVARSPRWACRSPPACRWRWTSQRTSGLSASACSGWTS